MAAEKIKFLTCDEKEVETDVSFKNVSKVIEDMLEMANNTTQEEAIKLESISASTLHRIINWAVITKEPNEISKEGAGAIGTMERASFDLSSLTFEELSDLLKAADFLHIAALVEDILDRVAFVIQTSLNAQEIRDFFGLLIDWTPKEEDEIRDENKFLVKRNNF